MSDLLIPAGTSLPGGIWPARRRFHPNGSRPPASWRTIARTKHGCSPGLNAVIRHGVKPGEILVYMLIGYWPWETHEDREYRRRKLREFGALPYPMPYVRTPELVGFQRWVVRRADLMVSWENYRRANFRPELLPAVKPQVPTFHIL